MTRKDYKDSICNMVSKVGLTLLGVRCRNYHSIQYDEDRKTCIVIDLNDDCHWLNHLGTKTLEDIYLDLAVDFYDS